MRLPESLSESPTNRSDPQAQKRGLIDALNEHRLNSIGELRRTERIFATLGSADLTQPMTAACKWAAESERRTRRLCFDYL